MSARLNSQVTFEDSEIQHVSLSSVNRHYQNNRSGSYVSSLLKIYADKEEEETVEERLQRYERSFEGVNRTTPPFLQLLCVSYKVKYRNEEGVHVLGLSEFEILLGPTFKSLNEDVRESPFIDEKVFKLKNFDSYNLDKYSLQIKILLKSGDHIKVLKKNVPKQKMSTK